MQGELSMDVNNFFVDFNTYCETCKYKNLEEFKDPCNDCIEVPVRESTRIPECWVNKEE